MTAKAQVTVDRLWYAVFSFLFVAEVIFIWHHGSSVLLKMEMWQIVIIAFATKHLAHTISFFGVSDWWRHPFVEKTVDSSGAGENNDPKSGPLKGIGELICCHVCSGTHAASLLVGIYSLNVNLGWTLAVILCVASVSTMVSYIQESQEWGARHSREQAGSLWLEKNGIHSFGWANKKTNKISNIDHLYKDLEAIRQKSI